ncbi:hydroxymethylglutaryl-CoA synthase-like [Ylistrum balloti]|uniref:hydroxymethylglutaryl-CoA synthase-like n=1 Tax=Ylistrum balloti TaxID=509963 RepID=UPI002905EB51|nr:hydroxymethylglutaryl-CoA synthase-like [Ylistrum balloti]
MISKETVGIDNIGYYIPKPRVPVQLLLEKAFKEYPETFARMQNAVKTTGQKCIRITQSWQDSVCLATESVLDLLQNISLEALRFVVSATETSVDASKPISAYIIGILQKVGIRIPSNVSTYQTQHACAGGVISIMQCLGMISSAKRASTALVSMTDIARYEANTTAEITQGAGSVSVYLKKHPRLLSLDIHNVGLYSEDTDDFFRPNNSSTAKVRGQYSMKCYLDSVYNALLDCAESVGKSITEICEETHYFFFHLPFATMSTIALEYIFKRKLKWSLQKIEEFLDNKHIQQASEVISWIGNTYTSSLFFSMGYLLSKQYEAVQESIVGKKVLVLSYGSGNTSMVIPGRVAQQAPEVIQSWSLCDQLQTGNDVETQVYSTWMQHHDAIPPNEKDLNTIQSKSFYLSRIREDGYRVYSQSP